VVIVQALLIESEQLRIDTPDGNSVAVADVALAASYKVAKCCCAEYLRELGIRDPDVIATMTNVLVRRAVDQLSGAGEAEFNARLVIRTLEVTDIYLQKWIAGIEREIDLRGGASRCGEIAMRMTTVLTESQQAIESVEDAALFFKRDKSLAMSSQPPNNTTKFANQPLTSARGGILSELIATVYTPLCNWLSGFSRRGHA